MIKGPLRARALAAFKYLLPLLIFNFGVNIYPKETFVNDFLGVFCFFCIFLLTRWKTDVYLCPKKPKGLMIRPYAELFYVMPITLFMSWAGRRIAFFLRN